MDVAVLAGVLANAELYAVVLLHSSLASVDMLRDIADWEMLVVLSYISLGYVSLEEISNETNHSATMLVYLAGSLVRMVVRLLRQQIMVPVVSIGSTFVPTSVETVCGTIGSSVVIVEGNENRY